jgi:ABC-type uncharacterized transport system permease subunit
MHPDYLLIGWLVSYSIALFLEIYCLKSRKVRPRALIGAVALAAALPHGLYLLRNSSAAQLSLSTADWLLWAAWLIAIVYFAALFYLPRSPTGIVLLPITLVLILSSHWANTEPLASGQSLHIWGMVHGLMLMAGTVTVCVGFLAGLMYLAQSYALKHARSSANGLRLPSLEWLERVNSRTLALSALLIALGFISGVVMSVAKHRGEATYAWWTDPVVLSLAAMMLWLFAAEVFRLVYPAARQGRKVAYLTLASFVFLVIALTSFTLLDTVHGPKSDRTPTDKHFGEMKTSRVFDQFAAITLLEFDS